MFNVCFKMLLSPSPLGSQLKSLLQQPPKLADLGFTFFALKASPTIKFYVGLALAQTRLALCRRFFSLAQHPTPRHSYTAVDGFFFPYATHGGFSFRPTTPPSGGGATSPQYLTPLRPPIQTNTYTLGLSVQAHPHQPPHPGQRLFRRVWSKRSTSPRLNHLSAIPPHSSKKFHGSPQLSGDPYAPT
jgi:hypothetical protein